MKRLLLPLLLTFALPVGAMDDVRQFVQMPPPAQQQMRSEMIDMLAALHEITDLLAKGKAQEAGLVAESRIGNSARGIRHAGAAPEAMPGRHMPTAMRQLAGGMHDAGSEFASVAASGDAAKALATLPKITGMCTSCHSNYRTR